MRAFRKILPFIVSIILLFIIARLAPWPEVLQSLQKLRPAVVLSLFGLSLGYYAFKALRFWVMIRALEIKEKVGIVMLLYMGAQPVSLLPGGELYRARILERYRNVPLAKSTPTFTAQGLLEGLAMSSVGLACALLLGIGRLPVVILATLVVVALIGIRRGQMAHIGRIVNAAPFINVSAQRLRGFSRRNQLLFSGRAFWTATGLSILAEITGIAIAYLTVHGLGGHISVIQAGLIYIVPLLVGFVSFLPGGFGASEQSMIGLLLLMGEDGGRAVAATLVIRAFIVGTGFVYGSIALLIIRLGDFSLADGAARE